ncbi:MAG: FG-GAP repeat protein, partial [Flavobacteriaceae bacterium]
MKKSKPLATFARTLEVKLLAMMTFSLLLMSFECNKEVDMVMDDATKEEQPDGEENQNGDPSQSSPFEKVTRITPGGIKAGDFFGFDIVATSQLTAVSAPFSDDKGQRSGAVYIFKREGTQFENTAHTLYIDNPTNEDNFGWSMAMDGDLLVVGAPKNDKYGENAGLALIFEHQGGNQWSLIKELKAPNAHPGQLFGDAVSVYGGTIAIAAQFDEDNYYDEGNINNGAGFAQGSVYLYSSTTDWEFAQKLLPKEGQGHKWDAFGTSVILNEQYLLVGAKGTDNTT